MIDFTMNDGNTIPALGYGVFQMTSEEGERRLTEAPVRVWGPNDYSRQR